MGSYGDKSFETVEHCLFKSQGNVHDEAKKLKRAVLPVTGDGSWFLYDRKSSLQLRYGAISFLV